jgi:hypothetical protein
LARVNAQAAQVAAKRHLLARRGFLPPVRDAQVP